MRITDIIRGVLDIVDAGNAPAQSEPDAIAVLAQQPDPEPEVDLLAVIQHLAGVETTELEYANEPCETVAPLAAAFPGGDDVHSRKNPADIRTNAPSMYPGYQAGGR
jgi:hypothetical protein